MPNIIEFYSGEENGKFPHSLKEILSFDDRHMEAIHNYIQWIFPTNDPNNKLKGKPYLDDDEIKAFHENTELGKNLRWNLFLSFLKMMKYYGFEVKNDPLRIEKAEDFERKTRNWISRGNHNYLRITRIMESLRLLGLELYAKMLFHILEKVYEDYSSEIGDTSWRFWKKAADEETAEDKKDEDVFYDQLKKKLGVK